MIGTLNIVFDRPGGCTEAHCLFEKYVRYCIWNSIRASSGRIKLTCSTTNGLRKIGQFVNV